MKFSIAKGTKRFLIDLVFLYKNSWGLGNDKMIKNYNEMLKFLYKGDYDDE